MLCKKHMFVDHRSTLSILFVLLKACDTYAKHNIFCMMFKICISHVIMCLSRIVYKV